MMNSFNFLFKYTRHYHRETTIQNDQLSKNKINIFVILFKRFAFSYKEKTEYLFSWLSSYVNIKPYCNLRWNLKNLSRGLNPPKSAKTRFKWSAGLNLETFDTILSGIIFKPRLKFKPPLKFFKFGHWFCEF